METNSATSKSFAFLLIKIHPAQRNIRGKRWKQVIHIHIIMLRIVRFSYLSSEPPKTQYSPVEKKPKSFDQLTEEELVRNKATQFLIEALQNPANTSSNKLTNGTLNYELLNRH